MEETTRAPIRVILADDHAVLRMGIRSLLNQSPDIKVVGEAGDGVEAIQQVNALRPDVLVLDMEMPEMDGVEVTRYLQAEHSPVNILVLSAYNDREYIQETLQLGVAGYLIKDEAPASIIEAVRGIARGERGWLSRKVAEKMTQQGMQKE
jgi:DNA-binding NarL/FixJ family response regulator